MERIPRRTWWAAGLVGAAIVLFSSCAGDPTSPAGRKPYNTAPRIDSISMDPPVLAIGSSSVFTCYAHDPDGDALSFTWRASEGDFVGSGSQVRYLPASCCSGFAITVRVTVGDGQADTTATVMIPVF